MSGSRWPDRSIPPNCRSLRLRRSLPIAGVPRHPEPGSLAGVHASRDPWRSQGPWRNSSSQMSPSYGTSIRVNFVVTAAIAAAKLVSYKWGKVFAPQIGREKKNFGHLFFDQNWAFFGPKRLFFRSKFKKKKKSEKIPNFPKPPFF